MNKPLEWGRLPFSEDMIAITDKYVYHINLTLYTATLTIIRKGTWEYDDNWEEDTEADAKERARKHHVELA